MTHKSVLQECHLDICSFSNVFPFGFVGSILFFQMRCPPKKDTRIRCAGVLPKTPSILSSKKDKAPGPDILWNPKNHSTGLPVLGGRAAGRRRRGVSSAQVDGLLSLEEWTKPVSGRVQQGCCTRNWCFPRSCKTRERLRLMGNSLFVVPYLGPICLQREAF